MCRLFGMSAGPHRAKATFWLLEAPDSLLEQSKGNPDGTGLGWFEEDGRPCVAKEPIAAYTDRAFARRAREVCSSTFVSHIRFASTGALTLANTHPFIQDGRLFAHNGVVEDLPRLEAELGQAISLVQGETDSERLFALITREIRAHGVSAGIESACRWVAENLPLFAINFVLAAPDGLWALRYPDSHELYVLERVRGNALKHASSLGTRVRSDHQHPLVVVASERLDEDPDWRPLASGELLHIDRELRCERRTILPHAPAQLLTLADLHPLAAASQSPH